MNRKERKAAERQRELNMSEKDKLFRTIRRIITFFFRLFIFFLLLIVVMAVMR